MASNRPAPEGPSAYDLDDRGAFPGPGHADNINDGPWEEWNPTEDSVRSVRGKHRVAKQRGGGLARGGTVLGVGVIAAVGAGGMATAEGRPPVPISMPDVGGMADDVADKLPDAKSLPGVGDLISDEGTDTGAASASDSAAGVASASDSGAGVASVSDSGADAGEALRSRILQQADAQQGAAEQEARETAEHTAFQTAVQAADAHQKSAEKAAAAKKAAELEAKREAEEAARQKAEAARLAKLAKNFIAPVSSFTLTASFGQAGDRWAADHTGQDFAAPAGTPVKAVHSGTITQAGWAGSYGYRIVLTLDDGTELWFCHLSSMVKTSGKVGTGDVIGRVGATGNVTGPHLHLEVRPGAGDPIDPMPWLRDHGIKV
ncbi:MULTISPECIES: M23 family metallopeptidase [unclassified Streptomyces]|uniref:M23 family metallopeptidase n=1 Tax=unclassified Streptomyces TaxID=2593676 RepID=UPI000880EF4D|nr:MULTISPECIES: M23 family metallopeptidase [unclassified Streptomyces]PBC83334.1 murein DD-endopeptidase MepM/ murein hydrolase activator NlpD [Streptomyces sp. 2321.6]SDR43307.1 Murein DD-endopeptidase MepM and murein hydrolase activator NlpD, contain LysM domain [Streptomyces sp. KS_16]SEC92856.1 Murein DD-endopeptidase MepM and murein hydrolase activator NlpD, contain LysM domain [Streptomyces sp. 2133.1]SEE80571.1 Murein DD-endopeptidase MepM and murein hydrolase activator NlpD, contain L